MVLSSATTIHSYWLLLHFLIIIPEECWRKSLKLKRYYSSQYKLCFRNSFNNTFHTFSWSSFCRHASIFIDTWYGVLADLFNIYSDSTEHIFFKLTGLAWQSSDRWSEHIKADRKKETFQEAQKKTSHGDYSNQAVTINFLELPPTLEWHSRQAIHGFSRLQPDAFQSVGLSVLRGFSCSRLCMYLLWWQSRVLEIGSLHYIAAFSHCREIQMSSCISRSR